MNKPVYTDEFVNPVVALSRLRTKYFPTGNKGYIATLGYETERAQLKAVLLDQYENLHSLVDDYICSCGLIIDPKVNPEPDAILKLKGHRDHVTLKRISYVSFRGKLNNRLFFKDLEHPVDAKWNYIVDFYFPEIVFSVQGENYDN
ncbi:MAG: hypothetical protein RIQ88_384 [Actinomycetota bacterium]